MKMKAISSSNQGKVIRRSRRSSILSNQIPIYNETKLSNRNKRSQSQLDQDDQDHDDDDLEDDDEKKIKNKRIKLNSKTKTKTKTKKLRNIKLGLNPLPNLFTRSTSISPTLFVFGEGGFGQHGLGTADNVLCEIKKPRLHQGFEKLIAQDESWSKGVPQIECGGMHTLAIDADGKVWSWGINDNAALGRVTSMEGVESEELESVPMLVEGLQDEGFKAVRVDAGDSVSLALSDRGELRCWGSFRTSEGLLGFSGKPGASQHQLKPVALENLASHTIVQLATGDDHFLALTSDGHVFACGNGEQHQLGRKIIARHKTHGLTPERLALKDIVHVGSGSYHSFAVSSTGIVYAWGLNSFHQTGVAVDDGGWEETIATPTPVAALDPSQHDGARVVQIAGGEHHSLFLFSNGQVWACGRSDGHETGLASIHPEMVAGEARKAAALVLRAAKTKQVEAELLARGGEATEEDEMVMDGPTAALAAQRTAAEEIPLPNPFIPLPTLLSFESDDDQPIIIVDIAAGTRHNLAVASNGSLFAWGVGESAQLGLGDDEEADVPTRVTSLAMQGFKVIRARTGGQHSVILAIRGDGAKPTEFERILKVPAELAGVDDMDKSPGRDGIIPEEADIAMSE